MQNKSIGYVIVGLALIAGLFALLRPKQQDKQSPNVIPPPASEQVVQSFNLVIKGKKLISGPKTIVLKEGDKVKITITADEAEEWHLHGYDKMVVLEKDKPAQIAFTANLTGRFIYELERSSTEIGTIEVRPK
ncbi:MAG TPA: hypothetical protein VF974_05680 [Patescibacteria group bacterium]